MFSAMPFGGLCRLEMSSQFLNAARWWGPQNLDGAFNDGQSTGALLNPGSAQSFARRDRYCGIWKRKLREPPPPRRSRSVRLGGEGSSPSAQRTIQSADAMGRGPLIT